MLLKRRYLPSLGSFATFEVAAKHLSFTLAGNELNVTQAAISQQIRGLEKSLGVTLFIRKHNSLELTSDGQRLLTAVSGGLDIICDGINNINAPSDPPVITCSGTNAAIACWLKPLVNRFRSDRPDVRFVLLASDEDDTLRNFDEVDLSLICGNERCEVGENLYYLFPDIVQPVCSPDYLERHGPFPDAQSLERADLLDLHRKHWTSDAIGWHPVTWDDWFQASGLGVPHLLPAMVSNNYPLLVNAAVKGEGIVLGWHHLVRTLMDEGALCPLFDSPLRVDRGYYLKVNRASLDKPHVQEFIDFVLTGLAALEQEHQRPGAATRDAL
ncbi:MULTISPECIES: LysR family transcriptional regulator [unclassified Rhizobium]|uniref:LysR family transcriptional regulator n=1 Tax=unclassified Rhizobium TaxID=2613769 RepID=UPI0007EA7B26|nr:MULTISPECIES: LysR family transcriptional regulator [unclassified Rhizobium]ANK87713.1 LysR family transcriptional regulator protein [Rhizobium sp. N731]ANL17959.1 LysR family transcriptional regulator protein [Rhizobium sp. N1314]